MFIKLKDMNRQEVIDIFLNNIEEYRNKQLIEKAIDKLIKKDLKVNINNMSTYKDGERMSWFSKIQDMKEIQEEYKNSLSREEYIIRWFFIWDIANQCSRFKNGYDI